MEGILLTVAGTINGNVHILRAGNGDVVAIGTVYGSRQCITRPLVIDNRHISILIKYLVRRQTVCIEVEDAESYAVVGESGGTTEVELHAEYLCRILAHHTEGTSRSGIANTDRRCDGSVVNTILHGVVHRSVPCHVKCIGSRVHVHLHVIRSFNIVFERNVEILVCIHVERGAITEQFVLRYADGIVAILGNATDIKAAVGGCLSGEFLIACDFHIGAFHRITGNILHHSFHCVQWQSLEIKVLCSRLEFSNICCTIGVIITHSTDNDICCTGRQIVQPIIALGIGDSGKLSIFSPHKSAFNGLSIGGYLTSEITLVVLADDDIFYIHAVTGHIGAVEETHIVFAFIHNGQVCTQKGGLIGIQFKLCDTVLLLDGVAFAKANRNDLRDLCTSRLGGEDHLIMLPSQEVNSRRDHPVGTWPLVVRIADRCTTEGPVGRFLPSEIKTVAVSIDQRPKIEVLFGVHQGVGYLKGRTEDFLIRHSLLAAVSTSLGYNTIGIAVHPRDVVVREIGAGIIGSHLHAVGETEDVVFQVGRIDISARLAFSGSSPGQHAVNAIRYELHIGRSFRIIGADKGCG